MCVQTDDQATQTLISSSRWDEFGFGIFESNKLSAIMIVNVEMTDESSWKLLA